MVPAKYWSESLLQTLSVLNEVHVIVRVVGGLIRLDFSQELGRISAICEVLGATVGKEVGGFMDKRNLLEIGFSSPKWRADPHFIGSDGSDQAIYQRPNNDLIVERSTH